MSHTQPRRLRVAQWQRDSPYTRCSQVNDLKRIRLLAEKDGQAGGGSSAGTAIGSLIPHWLVWIRQQSWENHADWLLLVIFL
jgi:hypothetical protein